MESRSYAGGINVDQFKIDQEQAFSKVIESLFKYNDELTDVMRPYLNISS